MKVIRGNSSSDVTSDELKSLTEGYKKFHIDLGTGDGRYVYKSAQNDPDTFFIGVDPSQLQLQVYSKKAARDKIPNCLFVLGSIEVYPEELFGIADSMSILMPWGSLLKAVVLGSSSELQNISASLKSDSLVTLDLLFGYTQDAEPSEVERLNLDSLSLDYIKSSIVPKFLEIGFTDVTISTLQKEDLRNFNTSWSKRLSFGQDRPIYYLNFQKAPKE